MAVVERLRAEIEKIPCCEPEGSQVILRADVLDVLKQFEKEPEAAITIDVKDELGKNMTNTACVWSVGDTASVNMDLHVRRRDIFSLLGVLLFGEVTLKRNVFIELVDVKKLPEVFPPPHIGRSAKRSAIEVNQAVNLGEA